LNGFLGEWFAQGQVWEFELPACFVGQRETGIGLTQISYGNLGMFSFPTPPLVTMSRLLYIFFLTGFEKCAK